MNLLEKVLSPTEKKNSKIIETKGKSLRRVLNMIIAIKDLNENEEFNKIVRVILINEDIVKLQTYDNGTPYIFVLESKDENVYLEDCLEILCSRENLTLTKIEI